MPEKLQPALHVRKRRAFRVHVPWRGIARGRVAREIFRDDGDAFAEAAAGEDERNVQPDDAGAGR